MSTTTRSPGERRAAVGWAWGRAERTPAATMVSKLGFSAPSRRMRYSSSAASRSVATRGLPFVVMNLTPIIACPASLVMLIEKVFVLGVIGARDARNVRSLAIVHCAFGTRHRAFQLLALFFEQNPPSAV